MYDKTSINGSYFVVQTRFRDWQIRICHQLAFILSGTSRRAGSEVEGSFDCVRFFDAHSAQDDEECPACFQYSGMLESGLPQIGGRMAANLTYGVEHPRSSKSATRSAKPRRIDKGIKYIIWEGDYESG